jgi:hypothetical protein
MALRSSYFEPAFAWFGIRLGSRLPVLELHPVSLASVSQAPRPGPLDHPVFLVADCYIAQLLSTLLSFFASFSVLK